MVNREVFVNISPVYSKKMVNAAKRRVISSIASDKNKDHQQNLRSCRYSKGIDDFYFYGALSAL